MGSKKKKSAGDAGATVIVNRKARHDYHILETCQAGLVLHGTEVKALREGRANLRDSYALIDNGEAWMVDCHIGEYSHSGYAGHVPKRPRKLLLHKREIARLFGKVQEKGLTMVPMKIYFVKGKAKVDIAVARGKQIHDKRETIKQRDLDRDMRREMAGRS